jgi:hypothetical protein
MHFVEKGIQRASTERPGLGSGKERRGVIQATAIPPISPGKLIESRPIVPAGYKVEKVPDVLTPSERQAEQRLWGTDAGSLHPTTRYVRRSRWA